MRNYYCCLLIAALCLMLPLPLSVSADEAIEAPSQHTVLSPSPALEQRARAEGASKDPFGGVKGSLATAARTFKRNTEEEGNPVSGFFRTIVDVTEPIVDPINAEAEVNPTPMTVHEYLNEDSPDRPSAALVEVGVGF
jgi:hypothetical protein